MDDRRFKEIGEEQKVKRHQQMVKMVKEKDDINFIDLKVCAPSIEAIKGLKSNQAPTKIECESKEKEKTFQSIVIQDQEA